MGFGYSPNNSACATMIGRAYLMVHLHWLSLGPEQGPGPVPGRIGCMALRRTSHTAPEQEQGPEHGQGRMGYIPIFQVLEQF